MNMIDIIGEIALLGSLVLPPIVFIVIFRVAKNPRSLGKRIGGSLCFAAVPFAILTPMWTAILFRDGLAVGMIVSQGMEALKRSMPMMIFGILPGAFFIYWGREVFRRNSAGH